VIILTRGTVMEETRRGRQAPLKVERDFAGSRLEVQILVRAYELAAPIVRSRTDATPAPEPLTRPAEDLPRARCVAKGA